MPSKDLTNMGVRQANTQVISCRMPEKLNDIHLSSVSHLCWGLEYQGQCQKVRCVQLGFWDNISTGVVMLASLNLFWSCLMAKADDIFSGAKL